jgi:acyl dehydratase
MSGPVLTGTDNYFESFPVGRKIRHWRGKSVTDLETQTLTALVMNTSEGHFNADQMRETEFGTPITFGGVVASIVYGLASQDTAEQALEERGLESVRFKHPTRTGDSLYVTTEVLEAKAESEESGEVAFRHVGTNQDGALVCEIVRRVLLRRQPA